MAHGVGCPPKGCLPMLGVVAMKDDIPKGIAFLYMCNSGSGMAFMMWQTTNPDNSDMESCRVLKFIDQALTELAKTHDYGCVFTLAAPSHERFYESLGYQANHPVIAMLKGVPQDGN